MPGSWQDRRNGRLPIVCLHGPLRFNQLREALPGISPHILTSRLRQFERIPPRVVYELTLLGAGLRDVLEAMSDWAMVVPDPGTDATA